MSIVEKIRRGEESVFVALAEELPEVFRTYVVPKLEQHELAALALVDWAFHRDVWSEEACTAGLINGTLNPHLRFGGYVARVQVVSETPVQRGEALGGEVGGGAPRNWLVPGDKLSPIPGVRKAGPYRARFLKSARSSCVKREPDRPAKSHHGQRRRAGRGYRRQCSRGGRLGRAGTAEGGREGGSGPAGPGPVT